MSKFKDMIIDIQEDLQHGQLSFQKIADVYGIPVADVELIQPTMIRWMVILILRWHRQVLVQMKTMDILEKTMSDLHILEKPQSEPHILTNGNFGSVRIVCYEYTLEVQKLVNQTEWVGVRRFHVISDDYAYTNAREYARELFDREFADILV